MKIGGLAWLIVYISIYLSLSKKIKHFHRMFDAIVAFETNQRQNCCRVSVSLISFLLVLLASLSLLIDLLYDEEINQLFATILVDLRFSQHCLLTAFQIPYLVTTLQFLYYEHCNRYYNVLIYSNQLLQKYLRYKPHPTIDMQLKIVLDDFVINREQFKRVVHSIKNYSMFILQSYNICLILITFICYHIGLHNSVIVRFILYISTFNLYSIITKALVKSKSKIEQNLIENIVLWRDLRNSPITMPMIVIKTNSSCKISM